MLPILFSIYILRLICCQTQLSLTSISPISIADTAFCVTFGPDWIAYMTQDPMNTSLSQIKMLSYNQITYISN